MHLLLDLSQRGVIHLALFDASTIEHKNYPGENRDLLSAFQDFLQTKYLNKNDVQGIMVVVGAGSFTSIRVATTLANGFAFVRGVPVMAILSEQASEAQNLIPALLAQPRGQYVSAIYSAEPNIGGRIG